MRKRHLLVDLFLIVVSIVLAVGIIHYGLVQQVLLQTGGGVLVGSFVAGMFFTSIVTTAPAIAVLAELSQQGNLVWVALAGACGALIGDYILFVFVRDRVSEDIAYVLQKTRTPRFFKLFKRKTFRRLLPFIGGLIIASPLPDELGLALLGVAHLRTRSFIPISLSFNFIGILAIGLIASVT